MEQNKIKINIKPPLRHFAKHLFLASRAYSERNKAKESVASHLKKMRKSIIRMRLSYTDIDRLKEKINRLVDWERKYTKFFKPDNNEVQELRSQISSLEQELKNEREEKQMSIEESSAKIRQLAESLGNLRSQTKYLFMERAKRQQRLRALDEKIMERVDVHGYYSS